MLKLWLNVRTMSIRELSNLFKMIETSFIKLVIQFLREIRKRKILSEKSRSFCRFLEAYLNISIGFIYRSLAISCLFIHFRMFEIDSNEQSTRSYETKD